MKKAFSTLLPAFALLVTPVCARAAEGAPAAAPVVASESRILLGLETAYARLKIDSRGCVVSFTAAATGVEYSPKSHPSPLLCLHEKGKPDGEILRPVSARVRSGGELELAFANGSVAVVKAAGKPTHFRFQLVSLSSREKVDAVSWGPLNTTISGRIGDIIGVVRSPDFAIGMLGLDDNTIVGPVCAADSSAMYYRIHSNDPVKNPVPAQYKEGQCFPVGGDGNDDVAFYSHPEEYFQMVMGNGAWVEPAFGTAVAYHSRDRRKGHIYTFPTIPGIAPSVVRHQQTDPVPGVDFIGSGVAVYGCPDDKGLSVIEKITLAEGLPYHRIDGRWIRDPANNKPDICWGGPHDRFVEYATALGLKGCQDEGLGEWYLNRNDLWAGVRVGFAKRPGMTFREFTQWAKGVKYGLHTLCLFLQGGVSSDVSPVPSERLLTVCRTKLAKDLSPTDTEIVVADPSFLAEKGTNGRGNDSNFLRIGGEMLRYDGISASAPWTLKGVKRGHSSKALAHKAGDELVKLQQNCYNGFAPDMGLMLECADHFAKLCFVNGMEYIDFDGSESPLYLGHGYYGVRVFYRRLFDTYAKLSGGKCLRMMGAGLFPGSWEYQSMCNVGGGSRLFDPVFNRWGIQGKDWRNALSNSWFPATFGIQPLPRELYDIENLQAKSVGWDATYMLSLSEGAVESLGDKAGMFAAFRTWEDARARGVFTPAIKEKLRDAGKISGPGDIGYKAHLRSLGNGAYMLHRVRHFGIEGRADKSGATLKFNNEWNEQSADLYLAFQDNADGVTVTFPCGGKIVCNRKVTAGQRITCRDGHAALADANGKKIADLPVEGAARIPAGAVPISVRAEAPGGAAVRFGIVLWTLDPGEKIGG